MKKDEFLFNDFEDNTIKLNKIKYKLIIIIVLVIIIIIGIILIFSLKGKNENPQNQENQENQKNQKNQDNQENQEEQKSEELSDKCPEIKEVIGGQSGTTYLYRYWDCCKPSCSRSEFEGTGKEPRICYTNMTILTDIKAKSVCNGDDGIATTCLSQIPFTINGC